VSVNGGFDLNLNQPDFRGRDTWLFRFCQGRQFGVNKNCSSKEQFTPKQSHFKMPQHFKGNENYDWVVLTKKHTT
jgi:hypothetical protein|tara:strand:+ start:211 stop:435 length:225 start_codon:yes stop_codon:yes gene_type:complete